MTGWAEIMSDGMKSMWEAAKAERIMEVWTSQIDEVIEDETSLRWSSPALRSQGKAKLGNATLEVLLSWYAGIDEIPPGLEAMDDDRMLSTLPAAKPNGSVPARKIGGARMKMGRGMTVDSGAADNVIPRRMVRGKMNKIRSSPGLRAGVHYLAANNARIANEGETDFHFTTNEGEEEMWTFQVAAVNKVLCAVSYLVDHEMRVIFDKDEKTGVDTSHILHKRTGKSIKMKRERNVWTIDAFIDEEDTVSSFARRA